MIIMIIMIIVITNINLLLLLIVILLSYFILYYFVLVHYIAFPLFGTRALQEAAEVLDDSPGLVSGLCLRRGSTSPRNKTQGHTVV